MPEELEYPPPHFDFPTQEISPAVWLVLGSPWKAMHSVDVLAPLAGFALKYGFQLNAWQYKWSEPGNDPGHWLRVNGDLWMPGEEVVVEALNTPLSIAQFIEKVTPDENGHFSLTHWLPLPKDGIPDGEEKEFEKKSTILAVQGDVSKQTTEPLPLWN